MNYPLVSIVIPTYNQQQYIVRAVQSALMQNYQQLEVIVSDDSTNNNTENILSTFITDNRIKYYHNEPRLGRVENYQKCLYQYAKGDWVLNLDGDDYLTDEQFIKTAIEAINEKGNNHIVFVQAGGSILREDGVELERRMPNCINQIKEVSGINYLINFALKRRFLHLTTLYNAKTAKDIEFYRFNGLSSDLESFMRLVLHGNVILLNRNVGVWFHHQKNSSTNASIDEILKNTKWIDSVSDYAISQKKLFPIVALAWNYLVKEQEITGLFISKIKFEKNKKQRIKYLLLVLKKYPRTFFFPVFIKKLLGFYFFKK